MFGKKQKGKISNSLEIVSMHIPKTAGTSFRNMLKDHFGEENAVRLDINNTTKRIDVENKIFSLNKLPKNIKVIHGHFYYFDLVDLFDLNENVKIITCLRNPVERVISNYFYLSKRLKEELDEEKKGLNILAKMQKSLIEYARNDISRNRMYKFLEGADLKKFYFIGFHENYNTDMAKFANLIGINNFAIYKHNITGKKEKVDEDIINEIEELNSLDIEIYKQAMEIKNHEKQKK